jgi:hypothetical protein
MTTFEPDNRRRVPLVGERVKKLRLTIPQPFMFTKTGASDRETQKRLLATAVEVERIKLKGSRCPGE